MSSAGPQVFICLGAGGVGKTTTSAALARASAASGARTLALTLDPARRLGDALGLQLDGAGEASQGQLTVVSPSAARATADAVEQVFGSAPAARRLLDDSVIFNVLTDALAGMFELATVATLAQRWKRGFDVLVVDTAPAQHAVDALALADHLVKILESRTLRVASRLVGGGARRSLVGRIAGWGRRPIAAALEGAFGRRPVTEIGDLLEALLATRRQLAEMVGTARDLFSGPNVHHFIVSGATPHAAAAANALARDVAAVSRAPSAFVLNRATTGPPAWLEQVSRQPLEPALLEAVRALGDGARAARDDTDAARQVLRRAWPEVPCWSAPRLDAADPLAVVDQLSAVLGPQVSRWIAA